MKYKKLISNTVKVGRFTSKGDTLELVEPNEREKLIVEALIKQGALELIIDTPKEEPRKSTNKKSAE